MCNLTHLECGRCGKRFEPGKLYNLCDCGAPLLARYDLAAAARTLRREQMGSRPATLWRYREVLPVADDASVVSLGEGFTPLLHARRLGAALGLPNLYLKDESLNPTGSFKARGMAVAVSMARELGATRLAVPSAGNAGGALAAYAASAGIPAAIFMPEGTPLANRLECVLAGARVEMVPGSIKDAGRAMRERLSPWQGRDAWFDVSTLKEPYRLEGKKTMAYEVVEQLGGAVPDAMIYPTGGGTGLIGMWKALDEMEQLGWIGRKRPRMFAVQSTGCAPMVRAFSSHAERAEEWQNPSTAASGLRVPSAVGDFLILRALYQSRGAAIAVDDAAMLGAVRRIAETEGLVTAPEGGATLAALERLLADGFLAGYETVVLFLTGSGYKYLEVLETAVSGHADSTVVDHKNSLTPRR
ncbi:MAG TPA: threonine synthase [Terriglobia bacterium]|nr:threonine synthase [Terriglobia bacterium]